MKFIRMAVIAILTFVFSIASARETLTLWHSFAGSLAQQFQLIADQFNDSQPDYKINLVYKGNYIESITSFAAAYHAGHPPDMVQVFEVGRDTMISVKQAIEPVANFLQPEMVSRLLPAVRDYYSYDKVLMAYPLNVSVPVMYYNKDALEEVWPNQAFPETWQDFETLLIKLKKAGYGCGYTTAFPAWLHFESFASLHGMSLISPKNNRNVRYQQPGIINHIERLKQWQLQRYFRYGGRESDATHLFTSKTCVIFSQSSGSWQSLQKMTHFPVGIAKLPLDKNISQKRYANTFGGAALWVVRQEKKQRNDGVRAWLSYISRPDIQWNWYQNTGYLPMMSIEDVAPDGQSKLLQIAKQDLIQGKSAGPISWGPQNQLRIILDQALESLFSQSETVPSILENAEKQANYRLQRFDKNYQL